VSLCVPRSCLQVLSALYGSRVPVPKAHLLCEDASVLGAAFYVMEFVEGRIFTDSSLQDFTASEQRAYYGAAVDVLAQLHRIRPADVGLEGFGKPTGYFRRQMETLSRVQAQQAKLAGPIPGGPL
jgi:aminoglycoside phosphotransferase (APT) family kinase protein